MSDNGRRALAGAVIGGVVAGGLALLAASRPWVELNLRSPVAPPDQVTVTGVAALPLTGALCLVLLAGSAAVLPTAGWVRRWVGAVVTVAAVTVIVLAVAADNTVQAALTDAVAGSPAAAGEIPVTDGIGLTLWRWVTVLAASGALLAGAATTWRGHRWAVMGGRYDAPSGRAAELDDSDPWRAMDAGHDPTMTPGREANGSTGQND